MKKYYVQDTRTTVGNSAMWWRPNSKGYTCDIQAAGVYSEDEIKSMRDSDKPWPVEEIDRLTQRHVDVQDLGRKPLPMKPHTLRTNAE